MSLRRDRVLDRVWLTLSGAAVIAVTLQLGARLGARPWPIDAVLSAQAAASVPSRRSTTCSFACDMRACMG